MKLEDLRARLRQYEDAERSGPLCICCKLVAVRPFEHPIHGVVCFWCNANCFDILLDRYDHTRMWNEARGDDRA
jgi:hypothetical protein